MSSTFQFETHNFSRHQKSQPSLCSDLTEMLELVQNYNLWIWTLHHNFLGSEGFVGTHMDALNHFSSKLMTLILKGGLWNFCANLALCAAYPYCLDVLPAIAVLLAARGRAYIPARPASPGGRREGVSPCTRNIWPMTSRIGRALPGFRNIIQIWQPYRYDVLRLPEKSFHVLLIKSKYVSPVVSCFY